MKGSGAFDKRLKKAAVGALTRAYRDVLNEVKYTEAFTYMKEHKDRCEFEKIVSDDNSVRSFKLLKYYIKDICKAGTNQSSNYKYYTIRNMYNAYSDTLVEIDNWGNLFLLIGACAYVNEFPNDREILEPLTEYITALIAIHNYIGKYEDFIFACMSDDICGNISDIIYDAISDIEGVEANAR